MRRFLFISLMTLSLVPLLFTVVPAVVLEEQIKFDVADRSVFEIIKRLDYLASYKCRFIGEYFYNDYYYDTPDFSLLKLGYSFRFRCRDKGRGKVEYGIQFKKEYDTKNSADFKRAEFDNVIPTAVGRDILGGQWSDAFSDTNFKSVGKFRKFLEENNIDYRLLSPVLYCDQERWRIGLDKGGQNYFEVSLDDSTFRPLKNINKRFFWFLHKTRLLQLEFENKFRAGTQEEDENRILALIDYFTKSHNLKIQRDSKYATAVKRFIDK